MTRGGVEVRQWERWRQAKTVGEKKRGLADGRAGEGWWEGKDGGAERRSPVRGRKEARKEASGGGKVNRTR